MRVKALNVVFIFVTIIVIPIGEATAAPGDLDQSFSEDGRAFVLARTPDDVLVGVAVQPDGKIVATSFFGEILRFNSNGTIDTTFGTAGIVDLRDPSSERRVKGITVQVDGKIVIAGFQRPGLGTVSTFLLVRLNADGSPDTSFDGDGYVITTFPDFEQAIASALVIQPDNKIVVAGYARNAPTNVPWQFALSRHLTNGSLDNTFNSDGRVTTPIQSDCCAESFADAVAFAAGSIVAAGSVGYGVVAKYNIGGFLNTTFNTTGIVQNSSIRPYAVAIQNDGRITVAGFGRIGDRPVLQLARFTMSGALDLTLDGDGLVQTDLDGNQSVAFALVLQPDQKIVVAGGGSGSPISGNLTNVLIARYNRFGIPDRSFSGDGMILDPVGPGSQARALALQADGKIIIAGRSGLDAASSFYVARYVNSLADKRFDFDGDGRSDISVFRPSNSTWYLNRSLDGFSAAQFGLPTDKPVPADYDDDGKTDICIFRDGAWWWINSHDNTVSAVSWGNPGDIAFPFNFNGDPSPELAVYRGGDWWYINITTGQTFTRQFGTPSDKPVPADYNGDLITDRAVYRNGEWHLSVAGVYSVVQFGLPTDISVPADYDGDGKDDIAVFRAGTWYVLPSSGGFIAFQWGLAGDVPAPADYDGDGKADTAVYRNGVWWINRSTGEFTSQQFGLPGDVPIPSAFNH